ncbi:MAG TPA: ATP-binding protein [Polyangiales bacterium]|nr:ATP-binding protein [Polyangiales bacterium]
MEALSSLPLHQSAALTISDESGIGAARRVASAWADAAGFDATRKGKLALAVTEAASNMFFHAGGGEIVLRRLREAGTDGFEMLAVDRGKGMRNFAQCAQDGYSTRGTSGNGLGSIARASDVFDAFSMPERGTVLLSQIWNGPQPEKSSVSQLGAVCIAISGEEVVGDGYAVLVQPGLVRIVLMDGLGHGQGAADATLAGLQTFHANPKLGPGPLIERMHEALRPTRGAAVAVVEIEPAAQRLRFAGVGNCSGSIHDPAKARPQGLASHNGTVGAQKPRWNELGHSWPQDGLLIMHTDGLVSRWNLEDYPGLSRRHPSVIAGVLYRDFNRQRDDVTVLAFSSRSA